MNNDSSIFDQETIDDKTDLVATQDLEYSQSQTDTNYTKTRYCLLLCLHDICIIWYLQQTSTMIGNILEQDRSINYKTQNDFVPTSVKLVYGNQWFSYYFYQIGMVLFALKAIILGVLIAFREFSQELQMGRDISRIVKRLMIYLETFQYPYMVNIITIYITLYSMGQIYQLFKFKYIEELNKLRVYQKNLEKVDNPSLTTDQINVVKNHNEEDGVVVFEVWVYLFGISVAIASLLKIGWLLYGLIYYKRVASKIKVGNVLLTI